MLALVDMIVVWISLSHRQDEMQPDCLAFTSRFPRSTPR